MRRRPEAKRRWRVALASYVIVSLVLVIVWAMSGGGFFWPAWVMAAGALLLLSVEYLRRPMTEAEINEEQGLGAWLGGRPAGNLSSEDDSPHPPA